MLLVWAIVLCWLGGYWVVGDESTACLYTKDIQAGEHRRRAVPTLLLQ